METPGRKKTTFTSVLLACLIAAPSLFALTIVESGIADAGENGWHALYALVNSDKPANATLIWLGKSSGEIYLLRHAALYPNETFDKFSILLASELENRGATLKFADVGELRLLSDSTIIIATGFFPAELNGTSAVGSDNVVIFIGGRMDYLVDGEGSLVANPGLAGMQGMRVVNGSVALDSGGPNEALARELAEGIAYERFGNVYASKTQEIPKGVSLLFTQASGETAGIGKLVLDVGKLPETRSPDMLERPCRASVPPTIAGLCGTRSDMSPELATRELGPRGYEGKISNAFATYPGQLAAEFVTPNAYNESLLLEFSLRAYNASTLFVSAQLGKSFVKQVYAAKTRLNLTPGDYLLKAVDQYGNVYAASLVHVKKVSFELDSLGRLRIYEDGRPYSGQVEVAAIDSGGRVSGYSTLPTDGILAISGDSVVRVQGSEITVRKPEEGSAFSFYLRYGPVAIGILIAAYFLMRPVLGKKYRIKVPEFRKPKKKLALGAVEFRQLVAAICARPVHITELMFQLNDRLGKGSMISVDESSVLRLLERAEFMKSCDDYYMYCGDCAGAESAWDFDTEYVERRLKDAAMMSGRHSLAHFSVEGREYMAFPPVRLGKMLQEDGIKIAVFRDWEQKAEFEKNALAADPSARLALLNGTLVLMDVAEVERWLT